MTSAAAAAKSTAGGDVSSSAVNDTPTTSVTATPAVSQGSQGLTATSSVASADVDSAVLFSATALDGDGALPPVHGAGEADSGNPAHDPMDVAAGSKPSKGRGRQRMDLVECLRLRYGGGASGRLSSSSGISGDESEDESSDEDSGSGDDAGGNGGDDGDGVSGGDGATGATATAAAAAAAGGKKKASKKKKKKLVWRDSFDYDDDFIDDGDLVKEYMADVRGWAALCCRQT